MDRKLYKLQFRQKRMPLWICPTCGKGVLNPIADSFKAFETTSSKKSRGSEDWDPFEIEYVYSCLLVCLNENCKEVVANSGEGFVDVDVECDENGQLEQNYYDYYRPRYFHPHIKIFSLPKNVPKEISEEVNQSFELIFCNPPSASNHIRMALENLLTHMKVKRFENRNGKKIFLNLHRRIDLIPAKYHTLKEFCLALKWLGNAGSHSSKKITLDDVLDAYEIMAEALRELFEEKPKYIKKFVKTINKKKGPKGKK